MGRRGVGIPPDDVEEIHVPEAVPEADDPRTARQWEESDPMEGPAPSA
jgi:hypothetical protein